MCRWIQVEASDHVVGPQLGLKVPRGHEVCAHPDGVVREGFVWCCLGSCEPAEVVPDDSADEPVELGDDRRGNTEKPAKRDKRKHTKVKEG